MRILKLSLTTCAMMVLVGCQGMGVGDFTQFTQTVKQDTGGCISGYVSVKQFGEGEFKAVRYRVPSFLTLEEKKEFMKQCDLYLQSLK